MPSLTALARWEGFVLLASFLAIVVWKLLTRSMDLSGLLQADVPDPNSPDGTGYSAAFSPGRAQLLVFTIMAALYYLLQVFRNPTALPALPDSMVALLGGSQATYLGGKALGLLLPRLKDFFTSGD